MSGRVKTGDDDGMTERDGYLYFSSGLTVGLACLMSGIGMSKFIHHSMNPQQSYVQPTSASATTSSASVTPLLDSAARSNAASHPIPPPVDWKFCCVMCYIEAIGLYGLIVALILMGQGGGGK